MKPSLKRGIKFYNQKRYQQAKKELLSLDEKPEENPDLAYYLGLCFTQLQEYEEAITNLEQAILSHTNLFHIFQCRMVLGYIYSVTGRFAQAEKEFKSLLKLKVISPQIYASVGYTLYAQKKIGESIKNLEKAIKLKPDYPSVLNNLGFIYAEEELDYNKAIEFCKKAIKLKPGNPAYLDSLGWAYFKKGNIMDAKAHLRKALELSKGKKAIATHLKQVLKAAEE